MFFNERLLLDLKLSEELNAVDEFIIVEADKTFQGKQKGLSLLNNNLDPKIKTIFLSTFSTNPWENEKLQRNSSLPSNYDNEDIFIVTDVDEINRNEDIPSIIEAARKHGLVRLQQKMYYYKINLCVSVNSYWELPFAVTGRYLRENNLTFDDIRRSKSGFRLHTNGKHFSYLGSPSDISLKIKSFSHKEYNKEEFTNKIKIKNRIANKKDPFDRNKVLEVVEIDSTYPNTILQNLDKWKDFIIKYKEHNPN